jgi:monosaccharide-transporting ATPase
VLLLDEPTAGLDAAAQGRVKKKLVELQNEGRACLIVEHDRSFLESVRSRILALRNRLATEELDE